MILNTRYTKKEFEKLLTETDYLQPKTRATELVNNFIKPGLEDLCVSRTSFKWGIPVTFDTNHIVYVWIDALSNYISALGYWNEAYNDFDKFWPADVHMVAKDIMRFHAIIWPAMLMALDLPLPKHLAVHGWITFNGQKMSKSLGNVVNPDDVVNEYGADTLRLYEMFIGDFEKAAPWNTSSIKGCKRFLDKIWSMSEKLADGDGIRPELEAVANRTIKKVGEDIDALKANTAIAQLMIYVNALSDKGGATKDEYEVLLELLNPFAPHMTEELWQQLGHTEQLAYHAWPTYDEAKCTEQTIEIAVQVNGKVKARIHVPAAIESADAIAQAKAEPAVAEAIAGKTIAKEIYVKGKLVNIAVKG